MKRSVALLLLALSVAAAAVVAYRFSWHGSEKPVATDGDSADAAVRQFCSACHLFPPPETLPRAWWAERVRAMYEIARGSADKVPAGFPPIDDAVKFYTSRAPVELAAVKSTAKKGPGSLRLRPLPLKLQSLEPYPGVSSVKFVHLLDGDRPQILFTEMRFGMILLMEPSRSLKEARVIGRALNPCTAEVVDLDRDGKRDVLVAALGTPTPSDATNGSVVWLRGDGQGEFRELPLATGVGRVAQAEAADFDGDGDLDIVAAVFGWRKVGEILLFVNETTDYAAPKFTPYQVDPRPGAIHVPVVDLDRDGRPDFVALISQQFETVVAFLNRGQGTFAPQTIFTAGHPNWGSTGIQMIDFDGDGDLDILFSNGDSLDDLAVKPYHGVQWLENRGGYPYTVHRLTDLYGCNAARAGDLDGDGDLDVVAGVFLPYVRPDTPQAELVESLIWLEQVAPGRFERWSLETVTCSHPTLDLGDFDGDGDLDIVVGNMTMAKGKSDTIEHSVVIWENLLR